MLSLNLDQEQENTPRELGANPRWRNALVDKKPDVFWRIGQAVASDFNCDGNQEKAIAGVEFIEENAASQPHVIIAISDNPATGRPESEIFKFSIGKKENENSLSLCSTDVSLSIENETSKKSEKDESIQQGESNEKFCENYLKINQSNCSTIKILWDNDHYKVIDSGKAGG
jgi:hypothetical protein